MDGLLNLHHGGAEAFMSIHCTVASAKGRPVILTRLLSGGHSEYLGAELSELNPVASSRNIDGSNGTSSSQQLPKCLQQINPTRKSWQRKPAK